MLKIFKFFIKIHKFSIDADPIERRKLKFGRRPAAGNPNYDPESNLQSYYKKLDDRAERARAERERELDEQIRRQKEQRQNMRERGEEYNRNQGPREQEDRNRGGFFDFKKDDRNRRGDDRRGEDRSRGSRDRGIRRSRSRSRSRERRVRQRRSDSPFSVQYENWKKFKQAERV